MAILLTFLLLAAGPAAPNDAAFAEFDAAVKEIRGRLEADQAGATRDLERLMGLDDDRKEEPDPSAEGGDGPLPEAARREQLGGFWKLLGYAYEKQKRLKPSAEAYEKACELVGMPRRSKSSSEMSRPVDEELWQKMREEARQLEAQLRALEARTAEEDG